MQHAGYAVGQQVAVVVARHDNVDGRHLHLGPNEGRRTGMRISPILMNSDSVCASAFGLTARVTNSENHASSGRQITRWTIARAPYGQPDAIMIGFNAKNSGI